MSLRTFVATATAAALFVSTPLLAQSMSVTPDPLVQGGTATIQYSNPALANTIVTIHIDNGMRRGTVTATVEILLDEKGDGTGSWTVPAWFMANFNGPSVPEVGFPVVKP